MRIGPIFAFGPLCNYKFRPNSDPVCSPRAVGASPDHPTALNYGYGVVNNYVRRLTPTEPILWVAEPTHVFKMGRDQTLCAGPAGGARMAHYAPQRLNHG